MGMIIPIHNITEPMMTIESEFASPAKVNQKMAMLYNHVEICLVYSTESFHCS